MQNKQPSYPADSYICLSVRVIKLTNGKAFIHTYIHICICTCVNTIVLATRIPIEIFTFIAPQTLCFITMYLCRMHIPYIFFVSFITAAKRQSLKLVLVTASRAGISITSYTRFHAKKGRNYFIIADWQALTLALFLLSFYIRLFALFSLS